MYPFIPVKFSLTADLKFHQKIEKMSADNNQVFVACAARTMKTQLNETVRAWINLLQSENNRKLERLTNGLKQKLYFDRNYVVLSKICCIFAV